MSTRVDYYLLESSDAGALIHFSCRLLHKAWRAGNRVFVLTESQQQSMQLNTQLWTISDTVFIPHALAQSAEAGDPLTRICIGEQPIREPGFDMLVNLQNNPELIESSFERVAEVVSADEAHKAAARRRYALWRDVGAEQNLHHIH